MYAVVPSRQTQERGMEQNSLALLYLLLLFGVWLLLPVIPAWLTYRITPNQTLGLKAPFDQITLSATGAFAAYFSLVLISYKFVAIGGMSLIGSMATPSAWVFKAEVLAIDENGNPARIPDNVQAVDVSFKPDLNRLGKSTILIRLPYNPDNWPFLTVTIPNFGGAEVDLTDLSKVSLDYFKKTAELEAPITVRKARGGGLGVPPTITSPSQ